MESDESARSDESDRYLFECFMDYPRLRDEIIVEPLPPKDGEPLFLIRDALVFKDKHLVLHPVGLAIARMFDGTNSVADVQAELTRLSGHRLFPSQPIHELVEALDENLLLDNPRFRSEFDLMMKEFRESPTRPSSCAGTSYAEDPDELRKQVRQCFKRPQGPGLPKGRTTDKPIKGLIAPHIDYNRGGFCYAYAYRALMEAPPADLFVILGTAHDGPRSHFILSRKDFRTPLGTVPTDNDFLDRLQARVGQDLCREEFVHRSEHSVELQVPFIQFASANGDCPGIVPVLCGGFNEQMLSGKLPTDDPDAAQVLEALRETIEETDKRVCVVASADLSHAGPQFGDDEPVTQEFLERIAAADKATLEVALTRNADDLFRQVQKDRNRTRICGLAAIYTMLSVIDAQEAELLKYGLTTQPNGNLVVSFCSMAFR